MDTLEPIRVSDKRLIDEMRNSCVWILTIETTQWGEEPALYTRTITSHRKFLGPEPGSIRDEDYFAFTKRLFESAGLMRDDISARQENAITGHPCKYWNTSCAPERQAI